MYSFILEKKRVLQSIFSPPSSELQHQMHRISYVWENFPHDSSLANSMVHLWILLQIISSEKAYPVSVTAHQTFSDISVTLTFGGPLFLVQILNVVEVLFLFNEECQRAPGWLQLTCLANALCILAGSLRQLMQHAAAPTGTTYLSLDAGY